MRVFSDATQSSPSGCKKLGKHGSRQRAVRRGQVTSITGNYQGLTTEYVKDIGYDEYGQRVFIEYGNGVKTEYSYNKERRWLANIRTQRRNETYQNIEYSFDKVGNVLGYKNDTTYYRTEQNYRYDGLYQLTEAQGTSVHKPYGYVDYTSNYKQTFAFDTLGMGNMTSKISSVHNSPDRLLGENINYSLDYEYDEQYAHRAKRIGNRYYAYDGNGNVVLEQDEPIKPKEEQSYEIHQLGENLYGVEYGWALENKEAQQGSHSLFQRKYAWNEKNLLKESSDSRHTVFYRYGADGQRAVKSSEQSETLYFNTMWSWIHNSSAYNTDREIKHIYLGSERLVTRTNGAGRAGNTGTADACTYYYHSDHLGSAHLITDYKGDEYERVEYTPYGEYWIEKRAPENRTLPFKFTGKERDEETGLYYYGARYLDAKTSRWLTTDPALSDYIPMAPVNDEAKKHNQNLPGMGGIYNSINMHLYHYAGNNPVKYIDPDGESLLAIAAVGFCIGAAIETTSQLYDIYKETGSFDVTQLDGRKIAIQGLSGMASSLLYVTGAGLAIQVAGNAMINTVADLADQLTDNKKGVDGWKVLSSGISGAIGGLVGGKGNKEIGSQLTRMEKRIFGALKKGDFSEIGKAVAYFQKNTGTLAKQFNKKALKDALKNYLPDKIRDNVIDEILNYVKKNSED